jgi:hypothetical protein
MKIKNPHPQTSAKIKQKIVEIDKMNTRNTHVRPFTLLVWCMHFNKQVTGLNYFMGLLEKWCGHTSAFHM